MNTPWAPEDRKPSAETCDRRAPELGAADGSPPLRIGTPIPDTDRVKLTAEELDSLMTPGEYVHTFQQAGGALVGLDRKRAELLAYVNDKHGSAELAGEAAQGLEHGAVIFHPDLRPTFVSTRKANGPREPRGQETQDNGNP